MLIGGVAALAATTLPVVAISRSITDSLSLNNTKGDDSMATITTKDGATIFYKDWGPKNAQPIVFHHGWPLSSDDWDAQMLFFLAKGYRVVAARSRSFLAGGYRPRHGPLCVRCCGSVRASRPEKCDPYRPFDGQLRTIVVNQVVKCACPLIWSICR